MIDKPGIYILPEAEYHADPCPAPSLSSSLCKTLLYRSPRHAFMEHPRLNPHHEPEEDSKFDLGSAAHALLLEGEDRMAVIEADDWRTKAAKEQREKARAEGLHPMLAHQYKKAFEMVSVAQDAIRRCTDLQGMTLADGDTERVLIWREGRHWMRARPDFMSRDRLLLLDYKTTGASAEPNEWVRTLVGLGFDIQGSFYLRGNRALGASDLAKFVFLVQECEPPYACSFVGLPPSFIELGNVKVADAIALWTECVDSNTWPAYPNRICWAELPAWAEARWQEREQSRGFPYDPAVLFRQPQEKAA